MTTQNEDQAPVQSDWHDPFPEPQTIPSGWDVSRLYQASQPDPVTDPDSASEMEDR